MSIKPRLLFYDFEVFSQDWMVVIIDYSSKQEKVIVNDLAELKRIYLKFKDSIWIGYNSRFYDSTILKALLLGMNPKEVSDKLINDGLKPHQISNKFNKIQLYNYDTIILNTSLKQLEGFMGENIKETSVDFNLDRKLTRREIEETIKYCRHDVEQTIKVFEATRSDFDAHISLINEFNLPLSYISKTKAQLSAIILGAERLPDLDDDLDYEILPCIKLSKYKYIKEWFLNNRGDTIWDGTKGKQVIKKYVTDVYGVECTYASGGLHGAIKKYYTDNSDGSIIIHSDVASLYPSIMIEHNLLSRAVKNPKKYTEILEKRLELKHAGKKKEQAPYKIVLNSTYGITLDKFSPMRDVNRGKSICENGQLLLTDLIEKLELEFGDRLEGFNFNTDGVCFKIKYKEDLNKYLEICKEWETRTKLKLEHDRVQKVFQVDVNNYLMIFENGKLERKGKLFQETHSLKNNMGIVNESIINYLVKNIPIEETINNCDELIKFQMISKIGKTYKHILWGDKKIKERVVRSFPCTKEIGGLFKVKDRIDKDGVKIESIEKMADSSEWIFIDNENVINKKCPEYLDKQYFIDYVNGKLKKWGMI